MLQTGPVKLSTVLCFATSCLSAVAQTTIHATDRSAFAANAGWIDFRPSAADGVRVQESHLAGYAYAANLGWIHFGSGAPANGHTYGNSSATDYGVNLSAGGLLEGYAWAPNVGWIRFEQTRGKPLVNLSTGVVTGSAWAQNLGWISLATASSTLRTTIARPDTDGDGIADAWEMRHFGNLTTANATSHSDGDGVSDLAEYLADTDPKNANSLLKVVAHSYTTTPAVTSTVTFTSSPNRLYRLEYNSDLGPVWTNSSLGTFAPDAGGTTGRTIIRPSATRHFIRPVSLLPLP